VELLSNVGDVRDQAAAGFTLNSVSHQGQISVTWCDDQCSRESFPAACTGLTPASAFSIERHVLVCTRAVTNRREGIPRQGSRGAWWSLASTLGIYISCRLLTDGRRFTGLKIAEVPNLSRVVAYLALRSKMQINGHKQIKSPRSINCFRILHERLFAQHQFDEPD
jgi:hypothetical protein